MADLAAAGTNYKAAIIAQNSSVARHRDAIALRDQAADALAQANATVDQTETDHRAAVAAAASALAELEAAALEGVTEESL